MKFWYPTSPVKLIQALKKPHPSLTLTEHIIFMLKYYNIEFNSSWTFTVKGGSTPIIDYLINTPKFFLHINSLKKKNIFYLDEITQPDADTITTNQQNLRLSRPLELINLTLTLGKRPRSNVNINNPIIKGSNEWVAFWNPSSKNIVIGRIIEKNFTNRICVMIYIEYWLPIIPSILTDNSSTPRSTIQALTKCQGCKLHSPYFTGSFICVINKLLDNVLVINVTTIPAHKNFNFEIPNSMNLTKKLYFLTLPLQTLSAQALLDFNTRTNQLSHLSYSSPNPDYNSSNISLVNNMSHSCKFLDLFFLDNSSIISLNSIAHSISQCNNIIFYTDGSCSIDYRAISSMGLGWLITNHPILDATQLSFSCRANKFLSSMKAESLALVSALATCPANSTVTINTDSKCIMDTFTYLSMNPPTYRFQKCNNYLIWVTILKSSSLII
ncbi:ribonuclease H-like domain-containing protein [Rhizophagus clarus]|uniref:Ribonuclease H-like domain-containing protein n=1 Tax=Rhizophagus clarus TaxID=94130 RepID=A0A8H3M449_9GLOM|nr:ribonuclease H-like domain-containing protein [Rhizophagus clarus]